MVLAMTNLDKEQQLNLEDIKFEDEIAHPDYEEDFGGGSYDDNEDEECESMNDL